MCLFLQVMTSSRAHIVNVLLLSTLVGGSILVFDSLPERMPRHAGLTGYIDAYWETTWLTWMLVPCIVTFLTAMLYGIAWLAGKTPDSINTPNQKAYDSLHDEDKLQVIAVSQRFLYWTATATILLIASIHWAFYAAVRDGRESIGAWPLPLALVFTAGIVTLALATGRRMAKKAESLAASYTPDRHPT